MSEFILIVPADFIELPNATAFVLANGEEGIRRNIANAEWSIIENILQEFIPIGYTLVEARLIDLPDSEERIRFWYKLLPIV
jgi:hypothetical protein